MILDASGDDGSTHLLLLRLKYGDNTDLWPMRVIAVLHVSLVILVEEVLSLFRWVSVVACSSVR